MSPKPARCHRQARSLQGLDVAVNQGGGRLRRRSVHEAGPVSLTGVGHEGELAYHEDGPSNVQRRAIEPPGVVGEDAELRGASSETLGVGFVITVAHPQEDQQALADLAGRFAVYGDPGPADALDQGLQLPVLAPDVSVLDVSLFFSSLLASVFVSWALSDELLPAPLLLPERLR